jgi:hypothetical protein
MKKNLIKSFALACGLLASMGVNAQNVAATQDGRQVGDKFTAKGVEYEVTAVETPTCKIVGVASGATEITVASNNILPDDANLDVFVLEGGLTNQFSTAEELEAVEAVDANPMTIPNDAFADAAYKNAILTIPAGSFKAYRESAGWVNFLNVIDKNGVILGDVNGDDAVDFVDVAIMRQYAIQGDVEEGEDDFSWSIDMNGDGVIDFVDVALLRLSAINSVF